MDAGGTGGDSGSAGGEGRGPWIGASGRDRVHRHLDRCLAGRLLEGRRERAEHQPDRASENQTADDLGCGMRDVAGDVPVDRTDHGQPLQGVQGREHVAEPGACPCVGNRVPGARRRDARLLRRRGGCQKFMRDDLHA
jgi:hypothetical protein